MHAIEENQRTLYDGTRITTYSREITSANVLEAEAGTTGYMGGDTGHGGRTYGIEGTCLVSVDADLPDGTGIGVETSTSDDLMAWSDWAATGDDGSVKSAAGQYIRFRLTLATTDTSTTPTLRSISLSVPGESAFRKLVINAHSRWR